MISRLRCEVPENYALLGYHAASSGNSILTFHEDLYFPSSEVNKPKEFLIFEVGTDVLSQKS